MKKLAFSLGLLVVLFASPAFAGNGGRVTLASSGNFFQAIYQQATNATFTFSTSALSPGGDTVIHVQNFDDPQAGFIAGNDDFNGFASQVTVPPGPTARNLIVIVRAYSVNSGGICNFTITSNTGVNATFVGVPFGGLGYIPGDLAAGAHVTTAEVQGGASDTMLLAVLANNPAHAVGYDDDDGVGFMSWIHLDEACPTCQLIVANFDQSGNFFTTLVWDDDADTADSDGDGLGNGLEVAIGSNPNSGDTDQDGIPDSWELFGKPESGSSPPVKFPYMGGDISQPDLFMELDWQQCTDPSCNGNLDLNQIGSGAADPVAQTNAIVGQIKADLAPLHVHLDIGRPNSDPSTMFDWGSWGGAVRGDYGDGDGCEGASPERENLFHFAVLYPNEGHTRYVPGSCILVRNDPDASTAGRIISHETGHTLGLIHGGRPKAISFNYKPQYESLMNYGYQPFSQIRFSHGTAPVPKLNPMAMDETKGLGLIDPFVLQRTKDFLCASGSCVNFSTGAVDWNRDGVFSPSSTLVQAPVPFGIYSTVGGTADAGQTMNDATMSWVNAGSTLGDQLFMFGRGNSTHALQYLKTSKTVLNTTGCGTFQSADSDNLFSNCAGLGTPTTVAGKTLAFGPGAAELAAQQILLVRQPATGPLVSNVVTINTVTGVPSFGANVTLPGSLTATGDVTALSVSSGVVHVFAPVGGRLKRWIYQSSTHAWSAATDMQWDNLTFISPSAGVGATQGYMPQLGTNAWNFLAIPTAPNGTVELAYQQVAGSHPGTWTKLSSSWSLIGSQPMASGRPGLAYKRTAGQASSVGRLYMAFNQTSCSGSWGPPCYTPLIETEGNLTNTSATTQRLKWVQPTAFTDSADSSYTGGVVLLDDINRDVNLRAAATFLTSSLGFAGDGLFAPVADGIINGAISDVNDYLYLTGALRASLCLDGGSWPRGVLPASLQ
jgi:Bacterial TSP3 repeat